MLRQELDGSITATGLYTAPASITSSQTVTVKATSVADPTKSATAAVTLTQLVTISLTPSSVSLLPSQNQTFTATVSGTSNTAVTWSINPGLGGLASSATTAVYVAPSTALTTQSVTITATSMADPSKTATAVITLLQAVTVSLSPSTVSLAPSGTQQFTATVLGTSNTAVTWSINPSVGTISSAGLYTAPSSILTAQTVTVTAQSIADPAKPASAAISLSPPTGTFTYYVDSANGSDANPGNQAAPWKTIAKVNATMLTPGQSVGFRAGGTWREQLTPGQSGNAGNPITFASYGAGAQPIINGANMVTGWSLISANVYSASVATAPYQVFFGGATGISVTSRAALTANYDWYYNPGTTSLYVYSTTNPSSLTMEATYRAYAALVSKAYINLTDLNLVKGNTINLYISAANNVTVSNCTVEQGAGDGVTIDNGSYNITLNGGTVDHNGENPNAPLDGDGIGIGNMGAGSHDITIENMNIYSNGNSAAGYNVMTSMSSTNALPFNVLIKNNTISNSNYLYGVGIYAGTGITVQYNLIVGNHYRGFEVANIHSGTSISVALYNNTIVGNATSAQAVITSGGGGPVTLTAKNNIFWSNVVGNTGPAIAWTTGGTTLVSDYNDIYVTQGWGDTYYSNSGYLTFANWKTATGLDGHSRNADPLFTNAAAGDYTLQAGSPAIGAGVYIPGVSTANPPNMGAK